MKPTEPEDRGVNSEREELAPARPRPRGQLTGLPALLFRWSIAALLATLLLMLLDILLNVQLAGPLRPWLPFILAGTLTIALTLGVGSYGTPERPGATGSPARPESSPPARQS